MSSHQDNAENLIQYAYDSDGNVTNLVYPGGRAVAYAYDSLNRLTNVTDWAGRQTAFTYDLAGHVTCLTRPNGTRRTIGYDAAGETTNIIEGTASGAPIAFMRLNWNAAARVQWEFLAPLPHAYTPPTRNMTFDDDDRLATFNGQNVVNDLDGNLTSGPLTNGTFATYTYNARNQLAAANSTTTATYGYDLVGNRTWLTNGASVTQFVVNPNARLPQVLMRIRGGVTNYYVYGSGLLYEVDETATSTNVLAYHFDYRGSTVALTDTNGNITDKVEYSSYGVVTYRAGTNDTPFLYNGRFGVQTDPNGLLYMRARYYNPYVCRFLNPDPSGFAGGLNWYCYADGNPVSQLDPFGLCATDSGGFVSWVRNQFNSLFDDGGLPTGPQLAHAAIDNVISSVTPGAPPEVQRPMAYNFGSYDPSSSVPQWANLATLGAGMMLGLPEDSPGPALGSSTSAAETTMARNPNVYEALFEVPVSGSTRTDQRASANDFLAIQLQNDAQLSAMFNEELGGDVMQHMESGSGSAYLNPPGTVWHHPFDNPDVMQLLRTSEHTAPSLQSILHPGGVGGFGNFYGP
jgi:RHS repeat-associated protein